MWLAEDGAASCTPGFYRRIFSIALPLGEFVDQLVEPADLLHQRIVDRLDAHAADDAGDPLRVGMQRRRLGEEGREVRAAVELPLQAGGVVAGQPEDHAVDLVLVRCLRSAFWT